MNTASLSFRIKNTLLIWVIFSLISCESKDKNINDHYTVDWPIYGGNKAGNRHSSLNQIHLENVTHLQVAWIYHSEPGITTDKQIHSEMECQPIVVNGILYATSPQLKLFALDAATGKRIWEFDPFKNASPKITTCRGVLYWENGQDKRILFSAGSNLYAIQALTGLPVNGFGENGKIDLHIGLNDNYDVSNLYVAATTPGIVYKSTLIIGSAVSEGGDAAPGYIRGFDILSGRLKWIFHTIPQPGEFGYDGWPKDAHKKIGAANNWSGITVDDKRGMVYLGTGSPAADFYGGARTGTNLFKGKKTDVVVQATKDGLVYMLDRDSGLSLFPVEERMVPTEGLPGEHPWPTQKFPLKPLPFSNQVFTEEDISHITPESYAYVKKIFDSTVHSNKF